jgi:hypothetical protein
MWIGSDIRGILVIKAGDDMIEQTIAPWWKKPTKRNGWIPLLLIAFVSFIIAGVQSWFYTPGTPLYDIIGTFCFCGFCLGFIGGWIWMPIVFYSDYKKGIV